MKNLDTVMRIAKYIRRRTVQYHITKYNYDSHDVDLAGWCAHTTNILFEELHRRGIRSTLRWNGLHCFLTYGKWIIDITATQFDSNQPKVVKVARGSIESNAFWWKETDKASTLKERKASRGWATFPDNWNGEWQKQMRKSLKRLKN